ncbi:DUF5995 family protein [Pseudonocardia humida]|uniref:tRNA-(MS[2]IO[6]A)-hydroxylase MiaE-like protein n=1 Tax=Pseudonocardia humida TaxID=2800819 RepID=A0ABT0ZUV6_9PSEU|nr:DUF5995 family protein [Pseudonocardia humida]MCO1654453.1 hypothetical protein [Pseudonocardia humida]
MPPTGEAGPIDEVLRRLAEVHDHALATATAGTTDGIVVCTGLYRDITARVADLLGEGRFAAPAFLARLETELADRFATALGGRTADAREVPAAWRLLLDNRADPSTPAAAFAVAGVNAHLNLDLAAALVSTWEHVPPDDGGPASAQYLDYCLLVDTVETAVDPLREELGAGEAGHLTDLAVRFTRDLAWDEAREVWTDGADEARRLRSAEKLDAIATWLGRRLLGLP